MLHLCSRVTVIYVIAIQLIVDVALICHSDNVAMDAAPKYKFKGYYYIIYYYKGVDIEEMC